MSITSCAAAAVAVFPNVPMVTPYGTFSLPTLMVAIGGHESGWDNQAGGDCGDSGPACGPCSGSAYSYGGAQATSWGWLQIHNAHSAYLTQQTGSSDPCTWRTWLANPVNCAQAALTLINPSISNPNANGIGSAWLTTYQGGYYARHLSQAASAVASVQSAGASPSGAQTSAAPSSSTLNTAAKAALVLLILGVGYEVDEHAAPSAWRLPRL